MDHKKLNALLWVLAAVLAVVNSMISKSIVWLAVAVLFGLAASKWHTK